MLRPELLVGQLLVHLTYSGVCRSHLVEVTGQRGSDRWAPHLLGHEGLGIVEQVGPGVTKVMAGDRVMVGWNAGEGLDAKPLEFHPPKANELILDE